MKRGLAWLTWWEWTNGRGLIFRGFRLGLSVLRFLEQRAGDVLRARASVACPLGPRPESHEGSHLRGGRREGDGDPLADLEEPLPHRRAVEADTAGLRLSAHRPEARERVFAGQRIEGEKQLMTARCPADSGWPGRLELTGRRHGAELGCCPRATGVSTFLHARGRVGATGSRRPAWGRGGTGSHQIRSTISVALGSLSDYRVEIRMNGSTTLWVAQRLEGNQREPVAARRDPGRHPPWTHPLWRGGLPTTPPHPGHPRVGGLRRLGVARVLRGQRGRASSPASQPRPGPRGLDPGPDRGRGRDGCGGCLRLLYRRRRGRAELRSVILEPVGGCRFHFRSDGDDHRGG